MAYPCLGPKKIALLKSPYLMVLLLSLISVTLSSPTDPLTITHYQGIDDRKDTLTQHSSNQLNLHRRQASLAWGPVTVGNLKLTLTNPHVGYAGPKYPSAEHVNFHVDRKDAGPRGTYSSVVNMHIVTDTNKKDGSVCLYAWDSVTDTTVFDQCADEIGDAITQCVAAIKDFVDTLLRNANFVASVAVGIALVAALTATLAAVGVAGVA